MMDYPLTSEVQSTSILDADENRILELLHSVYWEALEREICEVVLAYQEIEDKQPDPTSDECDNDLGNSQQNFEKFCMLLSKSETGPRVRKRSLKLSK
jgi:hypothetical protein